MGFRPAFITMLLLALAAASTAREIPVSDEQLFWVNGSWIPARDLKPDDEFLTLDVKSAIVQNIRAAPMPAARPCHGPDGDSRPE